MSILNIKQDIIGQSGVEPSYTLIETNDTLATVTTAGYLNDAKYKMGYIFSDKQSALVSTSDVGAVWLEISISGSTYSLVQSSGEVTLPVEDNYIASFDGTSGKIQQTTDTILHNGDVQFGKSGSEGKVVVYPATASSGFVRLKATDNSAGNFHSIITNGNVGQNTTYVMADPGVASGGISVNAYDDSTVQPSFYQIGVTVGQGSLASAGEVELVPAETGKRYMLLALFMSPGTNFSGGGGDRDLNISTGSAVYSTITAATLQSESNARWGDTAFPAPVSIGYDHVSAAGVAIVAKYSGGSADYTAGAIVFTGLAVRMD